MDIKIEPLTTQNFKDLPDFRLFPYSCRYCAFWESPEFNDLTPGHTAEKLKREWIEHASREFGNCGFILRVDGKPAGFAQYAPSRFFAAVSKYRAGKLSEDAIFLACLYIARRELRGKGIGNRFFEKVESDLKKRGYAAIETFAQTVEAAANGNVEDWYVGPAGFFIKKGFTVKSEKGGIALLRKELK